MLTLDRIRAADSLRGPERFRKTPLHYPASLNARMPGDAEERKKGIIAASAGNHAQGVALAASSMGVRARIVMPEYAPLSAEMAGATPIAALLAGSLDLGTGPVAAIVTGGNIDTFEKTRYIRRALAEDRRHLRIHVRLRDRRGSKPREMAAIFSQLAEHEINILDIRYRRDTADLPLGVVQVEFLLETRGRDHADALERSLKGAGFELA